MAPSKILDTHIHLWPETATSPLNHAWMSHDHFLAKRHGPSDYLAITRPAPSGFIFIETDCYLPCTRPPGPDPANEAAVRSWAKEPLSELSFLRRMVEGRPSSHDGCMGKDDMQLMKGCVIWAPFHLPPHIFQTYLRIAQDTAGPDTWRKVVGFRFLLQGRAPESLRHLVQSSAWLENIAGLGTRWAFDIGVDVNRDGVEGLEAVVHMVRHVRQKSDVRFVLNHMCKPHLSAAVDGRWSAALRALGEQEDVYMKLSGGFNEFDRTPDDLEHLTAQLNPFLDTIFSAFPNRVMFGSDWPVCNVGGPKGEQGNWAFWVDVVESAMRERGMSGEEMEGLWWGVGERAYGVGSRD